MLSRVVAVLILLAVGTLFLLSSEDGVAVSLLDWLRDPGASRGEHASWIESERARTQGALELDQDRRGLTLIDDLGPDGEAPAEALPWAESEQDARALLGDEDPDDLDSLLAASSVTLRGVVVGPDGQPRPGVTVGASQPGGHEARADTDERGTFELPLHGAAGSLAVDSAAWVALGGELALAPGLNVGPDVRVLVLAPRADLSGRTLDAEGRPLAGARAVVDHALPDVPQALRDLLPARVELSARSDADGRWNLAPLPDLPGLRVRFEAEGRAGVEREASELRESGDVTLPAAQ